jgi:hypothetical protein
MTTSIIFIAITILAIIFFFWDLFTYRSGGSWGHGKKRGEIGLRGFFIFLLYIVYVLIWGGIFWW